MDTYGHLFPSQDQALAEALNATLRESLAERSRNSGGQALEPTRPANGRSAGSAG